MLLLITVCRYIPLYVAICRYMLRYIAICRHMSLYVAICLYMSVYVIAYEHANFFGCEQETTSKLNVGVLTQPVHGVTGPAVVL